MWVGVSGGATLGVLAAMPPSGDLGGVVLHEPLIGTRAAAVHDGVQAAAARLATGQLDPATVESSAADFVAGLVGTGELGCARCPRAGVRCTIEPASSARRCRSSPPSKRRRHARRRRARGGHRRRALAGDRATRPPNGPPNCSAAGRRHPRRRPPSPDRGTRRIRGTHRGPRVSALSTDSTDRRSGSSAGRRHTRGPTTPDCRTARTALVVLGWNDAWWALCRDPSAVRRVDRHAWPRPSTESIAIDQPPPSTHGTHDPSPVDRVLARRLPVLRS